MSLKIINIYIFSFMRGSKSLEPKCIYVIEDDFTKQAKARRRIFSNPMTNNQLALSSVITALANVNEPCEIHLYTDSVYVSSTFADGRLDVWRQNDWINAKGNPVMNRELWEKILELSSQHVLFVEYSNSNSMYLWMKEQMQHVDGR